MNVSLNWLKEFVDIDVSLDTLHEMVSTHSQEIESIERLIDAEKLVIGYVKTCVPHPEADKLSLCDVDIDSEVLQIICGAPNVRAGQHVIVALSGAVLPGGLKIEKTEIRGVESNGMICSLSELGIEHKYHHEDGIHVVDEPVRVGQDALKELALDDSVMVLDLTPNRADLLSMHGVAYDVAAIFNKALVIEEPHIGEVQGKNPMKISTTTNQCLSYYGRVIDTLTIKKSPRFIQSRLIAAGIRPINNVVDITNYVMLETGQPLHAFDFDLLDSNEIVVREAKPKETFMTLDDKLRVLDGGEILITTGKKAVALGGVMGGAETEVHGQTKSILLESAVFSSISVGKTSRKLDLRSESSLRFERKVDPEKTLFALERATELFIKYANATVRGGVSYFDHTDKTSKSVAISLDKINRILGTTFDVKHVSTVLDRLALVHDVDKNIFNISLPSRRQDLEHDQDLIEEIGRISGYDKLPSTLPITDSRGSLSAEQRIRRQLRYMLTGLGFEEVITYSLRDARSIHAFAKDKQPTVSLANPMTETRDTLVLTPLAGMVDVLVYNVARKATSAHLFEIGKRYTKDKESPVLCLLMHGLYHDHGWQKNSDTNFYTLKGVFEAVLNAVGIERVDYQATTIDDYHPHQTALIHLNDKVIGHIGKIHPEKAKRMDLKDVYLLEVELEALYEIAKKSIRYQTIQKYPGITRDIAIVCDASTPAQVLSDSISEAGGRLLKEINVFDVYEGDNVSKGQKSLGLRLQFEDIGRTLETSEVDRLIEKIVHILSERHQAILR